MNMISDLPCPGDPLGRSYREVNAAKTHNIAIGELVELKGGQRVFVVAHSRDCDQTPLYHLSVNVDDSPSVWARGYPESSLAVVKVEKGQESV